MFPRFDLDFLYDFFTNVTRYEGDLTYDWRYPCKCIAHDVKEWVDNLNGLCSEDIYRAWFATRALLISGFRKVEMYDILQEMDECPKHFRMCFRMFNYSDVKSPQVPDDSDTEGWEEYLKPEDETDIAIEDDDMDTVVDQLNDVVNLANIFQEKWKDYIGYEFRPDDIRFVFDNRCRHPMYHVYRHECDQHGHEVHLNVENIFRYLEAFDRSYRTKDISKDDVTDFKVLIDSISIMLENVQNGKINLRSGEGSRLCEGATKLLEFIKDI